MIVGSTAKAKAVSTRAGNSRDCAGEILLLDCTINSKFTVGSRTPLQVLFIINVCSGKQDLVTRL